MAGAVGCALDRSLREHDRRSIVVLYSWSGHLASVLALQFVIFDQAICKAVEPHIVAELRRDEAELRTASSNVQGEIQVFRSETVNPAALEKLPSDIGIPLILSGNLWRSRERFRADYKSFRPGNQVAKESQHSVAVDGGKVYEFSSGLDPDTGMLRVFDKNTPEGAVALNSIEIRYYQPLDALWSAGGTTLVDMLQRPGSEIVPSQKFPGGYSMLVSADDGTKARFEFHPSKNHPLGYYVTSVGAGDSRMTAERRVFSIEKQGALLPTRIVDVVSFGPNRGYTAVVMLDLKPLEATSPIATPLTSDSFRNLGSGYQVYNVRRSEKDELAERYDRPVAFPPRSRDSFRVYFLWLNGFVIVALLALIIYRYVSTKKGR